MAEHRHPPQGFEFGLNGDGLADVLHAIEQNRVDGYGQTLLPAKLQAADIDQAQARQVEPLAKRFKIAGLRTFAGLAGAGICLLRSDTRRAISLLAGVDQHTRFRAGYGEVNTSRQRSRGIDQLSR